MDSVTVQKDQFPPTNQKRMIAFINHFIVSTVTFLNKFASDCESRFINYEHKIQNMEASLMIVEAKLASIDVLKKPASASVAVDQKQTEVETSDGAIVGSVNEARSELRTPDTVERDPKYVSYFKMLHLGVPLGAVKNKIVIEGLDPDYIDQFL